MTYQNNQGGFGGASRGGFGGGNRGGFGGPRAPQPLIDVTNLNIVCADCGAPVTQLPFQPDPARLTLFVAETVCARAVQLVSNIKFRIWIKLPRCISGKFLSLLTFSHSQECWNVKLF